MKDQFDYVTAPKRRAMILSSYKASREAGWDSLSAVMRSPKGTTRQNIWNKWKFALENIWKHEYEPGTPEPEMYVAYNTAYLLGIVARIGDDLYYITKNHNEIVSGFVLEER